MNWIVEAFARMGIGWTWRFKKTGGEKSMETPVDCMILNRTDFTDNSTIGDLYIDGQWTCFTLEPTCRKESGKILAMPQGKYEVIMYDSPHFKMRVPLLLNVPGHSFIEIHPGNCPADTHDCILLGQAKDVDYVMESRAAWMVVASIVEQKLSRGKFYIGITGGAPNV